ncbi:MAG: hypothetical protein FD187_1390 [bacterium]|nr:MAG: hypothetical protein FD142_2331 [bacterium]KAF0149031.1 MAG: hypothetical protein FD187_1390 [bacterium]KAF0168477.1 MAG: hypothetical protein FD158_1388 [bacterium]TXT20773.1 MAG: hypothetical protein FD132_1005 [bacterium]
MQRKDFHCGASRLGGLRLGALPNLHAQSIGKKCPIELDRSKSDGALHKLVDADLLRFGPGDYVSRCALAWPAFAST